MTTLILPNDFVNDTTADASPVQQNYSFIEQYINAEVITRDGVTAMQAPLLLWANPTQPLHAATKAYVDAVLPIGMIMPYGGAAAPGGSWMLCNGGTLSRNLYPDLHNVIGERFNVGTVSTSDFMLPNMAGRMMIGVDPADPDTADHTEEINTVGDRGGTTVPPLKQHNHLFTHGHIATASAGPSSTHIHDDDHDHASFNATIPDHLHDGKFINTHVPASGTALPIFVASTATSFSGSAQLQGGLGADGATTMPINIPLSTGLVTGVGLKTGTTTADDHTHTTTIPSAAYTTPDLAAAAINTKYRPPYITMSYIIRVL